ncbi:MAG TPA: carbohydrate ABC transporter permease [Propionibacteriaceae bacterium]|nr:carbohydrate ABC transporter permease [Propionibacteriaceae bacterium]
MTDSVRTEDISLVDAPLAAVEEPNGADAGPARRRSGHPVRSLIKHIVLIVASIIMIYPLLWMLVSSFRPADEIFNNTSIFPSALRLRNYVKGWSAIPGFTFTNFFINSITITVGAILGNLISCSMAAYAFARLKFRGRGIFFSIMLMTLMLPYHVTVVPQYIMFSKLHFVNTFVPLVLPKFLATDAFFVFLMVQFIRGLPRELDEAARIDGCGHARIFLNIILPLMVPAIATTTIFTFIWTWNDFFQSLIYLTRPANFTVPLALNSFLDTTSGSDWGSMFAMSVLSLVPVFLAFLFGQRFLVRGIATTGIK